MKKILFPVLLFVLLVYSINPAQTKSHDTLFVASWNLENLFDTIDDPGKNDEEFLPGSKKDWTDERLDKKLSNLAKVIRSMNNNKGPDILGVCEVEHESLLKEMISKYLSNIDYKTAYYESPDSRGIDNGLIFNSDKFKLLSITADTVQLNTGHETRLIFNANLLVLNTTDTLHVFVNHWPSRIGGVDKTEPNRVKAASTLKNRIDYYYKRNKNSMVIVLGDFNDEPANESISKTLGALPFDCDSSSLRNSKNNDILFNLAYRAYKEGEGSYKYRDNWDMLDQMIISDNLVNGKIKYICDSFKIFKPYFLITHSGKYEGTPFPTYGGNRYLGGYSDHFPITSEFVITKN